MNQYTSKLTRKSGDHMMRCVQISPWITALGLCALGLMSLQFTVRDAVAQKKGDQASKEVSSANLKLEKIKYDADAAKLDDFVAGKEKKLSKLRLKRIKTKRRIIKKNPQHRRKADILFQIAELEWDEAKYHYFLARKDYDKRYEDFLNGTLKRGLKSL